MKRADAFTRDLSQQIGLFVDNLNPTNLFGCCNGYHVILKKQGSSYMSMQFSAIQRKASPDENDIHEFMEREPIIQKTAIQNYRIVFRLRMRYGARTQIETLMNTMKKVIQYLQYHGYEDCCEHCGGVDGINACVLDGRPSLLCEQCYWDLSDKKEGAFHSERNVEAADVFGKLWTRARTFLYPRRGQGGTSYQMRDAVTEWNNRAKADSQE